MWNLTNDWVYGLYYWGLQDYSVPSHGRENTVELCLMDILKGHNYIWSPYKEQVLWSLQDHGVKLLHCNFLVVYAQCSYCQQPHTSNSC